jgi:hypothetical protein
MAKYKGENITNDLCVLTYKVVKPIVIAYSVIQTIREMGAGGLKFEASPGKFSEPLSQKQSTKKGLNSKN